MRENGDFEENIQHIRVSDVQAHAGMCSQLVGHNWNACMRVASLWDTTAKHENM